MQHFKNQGCDQLPSPGPHSLEMLSVPRLWVRHREDVVVSTRKRKDKGTGKCSIVPDKGPSLRFNSSINMFLFVGGFNGWPRWLLSGPTLWVRACQRAMSALKTCKFVLASNLSLVVYYIITSAQFSLSSASNGTGPDHIHSINQTFQNLHLRRSHLCFYPCAWTSLKILRHTTPRSPQSCHSIWPSDRRVIHV